MPRSQSRIYATRCTHLQKSPLWRVLGRSSSRLQVEPLESRDLLTAVSWDGGGDGASFTDPLNWDTNLVPGAADDVTINVVANPTITLVANVNLKSLSSSEDFLITAGVLTVSATSTFAGSLTMSGGGLTATGSGTTLSASGATTLSNADLTASSGATLSLPNLATFNNSSGTSNLQATGTNSVLSLPGLTSLISSGNNQIVVAALNGGQAALPALTSIASARAAFSVSTGGQLDVSALTNFNGTAGFFNTGISISGNGVLLHGLNTTTLDRVSVTVSGALGTLSLPSVTTVSNSTFTVSSGANWGFPSVTSMSNSTLLALTSSTLTLPNLASYSYTHSANFIEANGAGSTLLLPGLTSITASGNLQIPIRAIAGGQVTMDALTSITPAVVVLQVYEGSQIDVSAMTDFKGSVGLNPTQITVSGNGTLLHNMTATTLERVSISLSGAAAMLSLPTVTSLGASTLLHATGGAIWSLPNVTSASDASLAASAGGTLELPDLASYSYSASPSFSATDADSSLSLPALNSVTGGSEIFTILAEAGQVSLPALTSIALATVRLIAEVGGQIDASALTSLNSTSGVTFVEISSGGTLLHTVNTTTLDNVDITVSGASTTLNLPSVTTVSNSTLTATAGSIWNLPNVTSLTSSNLTASAGATLSFPNVTAYGGSSGTRTLRATDAGSFLLLPALASLVTTSQSLQFRAQTGGYVDLAALGQITSSSAANSVSLSSTGMGSHISLPSLTTFSATSFSSITTSTGGTLNTGNNPGTTIRNVTLVSDTTFTLGSNQSYTSDGSATMNVANLLVQGALLPNRVTVVDLNGNLTVDGAGVINNITVTGTIKMSGSLLGNTTNNTQFNSQGFMTFDGAGTAGTPQRLEAMSADLGAIQSAFDNNFAIGTFSLANNTYAQLVDLADNSAGAGNEAVYVKKLNVPAGTTLDLNGLNLYVRGSTVAGTVINGTITTVTQNAVVNRRIFYNNSSKYDSLGPAIMPFSDDNAIAYDKVALLPGAGAATFANVSSYTRGLNGVVIDITGTHGVITAADFIFRVGNNNTPSTWVAAPAPTTVTVRAGAGTGADRVEIIWADNAITNKWLEVIVLANANTGLPHNSPLPAGQADVFYFGNAMGDSGLGNTATQANVSLTDSLAATNNPQSLFNNIPITNLFDYNRDGQVNTTDALVARNNPTNIGNVTRFISVANPPTAPEVDPVSASALIASGLSAPSPRQSSANESVSVRRVDQPLNLNHHPVQSARFPETSVDRAVLAARQVLAAVVDNVYDELEWDELLDGLLESS